MSEINLTVEDLDLVELYGRNNENLNLLAAAFPEVNITSRGNSLKIAGDKSKAQKVKSRFELMVRMLKEHKELSRQTVEGLLNGDNPFKSKLGNGDDNPVILHGRSGKIIKAKTVNQKLLFEASEKNDLVFAVGPAGTGKTYTAVAMAVRALKNKLVKKIIMTRPAVEAGENLGFLPGDLKDKVDPYLRPLYDALDDMIPAEKLKKFMEERTIEVAPLAFMRGRTLDNAFVILDEGQNCTNAQMKMFLTRLGPSARCIITGDLSQIDLPYKVASGMKIALDLLRNVRGIARVNLSADDVVRHRLVKEIIIAYEKEANRKRAEREAFLEEEKKAAAKSGGDEEE